MIDGRSLRAPHVLAVGSRRRLRARTTGLAALLLALAAGSLPGAPAAAAAEACWDAVHSDVDGGGPDVVVGLPSYDLPGKPDAGALVVYSNVAGPGESNPSPPARRTLVTAAHVGIPTQAGARFGAVVVVWRQLGEPCAELLVGAPGQTVGGDVGAGRAYVLPSSDTGLGPPRETFDEDVLSGTGGAQRGAGFGAALAADGPDLIAFGVPGRDVGSAADAGRVVRLDRRGAGAAEVTVVQQGGTGAGLPEPDDRFGQVLRFAAPGVGPLLLVGVPGEDVGRRTDAGAVALQRPGAPLSMVTQDSPGAGGRAEAGDRYGASLATWETFPLDHPVVMVAVGVPGEDIGGKVNAGLVSYAAVDLFETSEDSVGPIEGRGATVSQDSPGVPGAVEGDDRFGSAVLTGEFGAERLHLAVGAPGENLGSARDAGMVSVTRIRPEDGVPASGAQPAGWTQDGPGVTGRAETGDGFGAVLAGIQLATVQQDEDSVWAVVLVTVPGEDGGATSNSGMAHLGMPPGAGSVPLIAPVTQAGAGAGMIGQQMLLG